MYPAYAEVTPLERRARNAVHVAVKKGHLPCVRMRVCKEQGPRCKGTADDYDHVNGYEKEHWLDVEPVCRPCHNDRSERRGQRIYPEKVTNPAALKRRRERYRKYQHMYYVKHKRQRQEYMKKYYASHQTKWQTADGKFKLKKRA